MYDKPKLGFWEHLALVGAAVKSGVALIIAIVTGPFRGSHGASTYKHHVLFAFMRTFLSSTTIRHSHALGDTTVNSYHAFAKSKGFQPEVVEVGDAAVGCWIGDKNAELVMLWFHGGGYVLTANKGHMSLLWNLVSKADSQGKRVAVLILQYDVAPYATYPRQLVQATDALEYLLQVVGKLPHQVILGGDSAGGNLSLALISHLMHRHPKIKPLEINPAEPLLGVLLASPWVTFDQTAPSFERNALKDCLHPAVLKAWSKAFSGDADRDNYTTPLDAPPSWWKRFPAKHVLLLAGSDELFVDDIESFSRKLKASSEAKVEYVEVKGDPHDAAVLEAMMDAKLNHHASRMEDWLFGFI